jgi:hypothetical protein
MVRPTTVKVLQLQYFISREYKAKTANDVQCAVGWLGRKPLTVGCPVWPEMFATTKHYKSLLSSIAADRSG